VALNFCRIVHVLNHDKSVSRFGFAYGPLPEHFASGEERFVVEWDGKADSVCYDILSFSRPGKLITGMVSAAARWLQRRFVNESITAMKRAVQLRDS
jgi:uncharacterized protein (UPF0548 family)